MTLQLTMNATNTIFTVVSDRRKHDAIPAVTEDFEITVKASGDIKVYSGTREISPAQPAKVDPVFLTDSTGTIWTPISDDGVTAVYQKSA